MGVLDQELQKLADFVGDRSRRSTSPDVDGLTGRSRGANVFRILDAVGDGKPAAALQILTELFEEGEAPMAVLGALGSQLRKLAAGGPDVQAGHAARRGDGPRPGCRTGRRPATRPASR